MVIETKIRTRFITAGLIAIIITLLLFYIDEGKYNFEGLFRPDNLIGMGFYFTALFVFQLVIQLAIESLQTNKKITGLLNGIISAFIMIVILASLFSLVA